MDIIKMRQDRRKNQIHDICKSIERALKKDKGITKKDIILSVMANIGLSKRTTSEYVEVALYSLGVKLES